MTDRERVAAVFKDLRSAGLTALMSYKCCSSCAVAALAKKGLGDEDSYVFFHQQNDDAFGDDGNMVDALYLHHQGGGGWAAKMAFRAAGFKVAWDGTEAKCVEVRV